MSPNTFCPPPFLLLQSESSYRYALEYNKWLFRLLLFHFPIFHSAASKRSIQYDMPACHSACWSLAIRAFSHISNEVISFPVTSSALLSQEHLLLLSSSSPSAAFTLLLLPEHSTGTSSEVGALALPELSSLHTYASYAVLSLIWMFPLIEPDWTIWISITFYLLSLPSTFHFLWDYIAINRDLLGYLRIMQFYPIAL